MHRLRRRVSIVAFAAVLCALPVAASAEGERELSVVSVDGRGHEIRSAAAYATEGGMNVRAWVRRRPASYSLLTEHLHIEMLNANGAILRTENAMWSPDRLRARHAGRVNIVLASAPETDAVRVSIVSGSVHDPHDGG